MKYALKKGRALLLLTCLVLPCFAVAVRASEEATLFISPPSGTFQVGGTFTASLVLDTNGKAVGSIKAILAYPPDVLQVIEPGTGPSIITSWTITPVVSNFDGTMFFSGSMEPAITAEGATVLAVSFRVVSPGLATLAIRDAILENDAGESVSAQLRGASWRGVLAPPKGPLVESFTHPDSDLWVSHQQAAFLWKFSDGAEFSWLFDQQPYTLPDTIPEERVSAVTLPIPGDGVWYFHLSASDSSGVWSEPTHYAIRADAAAPDPPAITVEQEQRDGMGMYRVEFASEDAISGIGRYEAKIESLGEDAPAGQGFFAEVSSPLMLSSREPGAYRVIIRVYDRAGNFSEAKKDISVTESRWQSPLFIGGFAVPRTTPWLIAYASLLVVLGVGGALVWEVLQHHRNVRRDVLAEAQRVEKRLKKRLATFGATFSGSDEDIHLKQAIRALHRAHSALKEEHENGIPPAPPGPET